MDKKILLGFSLFLMFVCLGFFINVGITKAISLGSVTTTPFLVGTDDLMSQEGSDWTFKIVNGSEPIREYHNIRFAFPGGSQDIGWSWPGSMSGDGSNTIITASSTGIDLIGGTARAGESDLYDDGAKVWQINGEQNMLATQVKTEVAAGADFFITIKDVNNPAAEIGAFDNVTWSASVASTTPTATPFLAENDSGTSAVYESTDAVGTRDITRRGNKVAAWSFSLNNYSENASSTITLITTTTSELVAGSKIVWEFPSGFSINCATTTLASNSDINNNGSGSPKVASIDVSNNKLIFTTEEGTIAAGNGATLIVSGIKNPSKGSYGYFRTYTTTANNGIIDGNPFGMDMNYDGPPPMDQIQIGGTNTINGTVLGADGSAVSAAQADRIRIGMGCPDKMFYVGSKTVNSDGTFTYENLLDARYFLFVMPKDFNSDLSFFEDYLQPAMTEVNISGGETIAVSPQFGEPNHILEGTITGGLANSSYIDIHAYNGEYETFSSVYTDSTMATEGLNGSGVGYFKIPAKAGSTWHIEIMTYSDGNKGTEQGLESGNSQLWVPTISPQTIAASAVNATTTLAAAPFVVADKVLAVTLKKETGDVIEVSGEFQGPTPCLSIRRAGTTMMGPPGAGVCQTMRTGSTASTAIFQLKAPAGAYVVEVMQPGLGFNEFPVYVDGSVTTTTKEIIISSPTQYIGGSVADSESNAINGVSIHAYSNNGYQTHGMTDSAGAYTLYAEPGTYTIEAFAPGFGPLGTLSNVVLQQDTNNAGNNFTVTLTGFKKVTGRIFYDSNSNSTYDAGVDTPYPNTQIFAKGASGGNSAITRPDGTYTLRAPSGTGYILGAWSPTLGALTEYTGVDITSDITKNWLVGNTGTLQVTVEGGSSIDELFVHIVDTTTNNGNGTDAWATSGSDKIATLTLAVGSNYKLHVGSPAFGELTQISPNNATTTTEIFAGATTCKIITLPAMYTISGTVTAGATVWVSRIDGPGNFVTTDTAGGTYSISVPSGYTYDIGAKLPGYIGASVQIASLSANTAQNLSLSASGYAISGSITSDGSTAIIPAFIWAEKVGSNMWTGSEVSADGSYSLDVDSGSWTVYAEGPCYYASSGVAVSGGGTANIQLDAISSCSIPTPEICSMSPATGGAIKQDNIEVNIPANALGTGSTNVSVSVSQPRVVPPATPNAAPIDNAATEINVTNSSGTSISNLSNSLEISITYNPDDLPSGFSEENLQLGYWNETTNTWDAIAAVVDTDANTITASVSHLSTFAPITPVGEGGVPNTPTGLAGSAGGSSQINLTWTRTTDATSYDIYRDTDSSGSFARIGSEPTVSSGSTTSYFDTGLSANTTYYYKISALNSNGESAASSAISVATNVAAIINTGGCAFIGSSATTQYCQSVTYGDWQETCDNGWQYREIESKNPTNCLVTSEQENGKKKKCVVSIKTKTTEFAQKIIIIADEAIEIVKANVNALLGKLGFKRDLAKESVVVKKYIKNLIKEAAGLPEQSQHAITNFVAYGTETTQILGEGERAGVVNSYKASFGKLPQTEEEWNDVIKIGNGRWPSERNTESEINATAAFKKVYLKEPDRNNSNDDAAVTVIAYGLRPSDRNLDSEKAAIKIFKAIYKYNPESATAWDIVRAIAYSGSTR